MIRSAPFAELVILVVAYVIWSLALIAVYGLHGMACSLGWTDAWGPLTSGRWAMLAAWGLHIAAAGAFFVWTLIRAMKAFRSEGRSPDRFMKAATAGLAASAVPATIWLGAPAAALRMCT